ncbi:hypothetical protein M405DRAFT_886306 [Rhizopogon salebrosus TDB-379]|nr:hypothetical protein M405DRAFT_886306 [Rhizopogon salebrosus TDB-379]
MGVDIANPGAEECLDGRGRAEMALHPEYVQAQGKQKSKSWVTPTPVEWVNKQGTITDSCQQCYKAKLKCHRSHKLADPPRVDGSSRGKTRVGDGMSEVAQGHQKGKIQEKEKVHENGKPKKRKRNNEAIVKDQGSDEIKNVNRSSTVSAAVHHVEEGANEDVVELPPTDTHVAESEAPVLATATDFPPDHFPHDVDDDDRQAMMTLQDTIQEVQQSIQIVQPPAAPSADDIRQHIEALRRQMEELSEDYIRFHHEARETQTQVSVMELEFRSLLFSMSSVTSQMTTMWNALKAGIGSLARAQLPLHKAFGEVVHRVVQSSEGNCGGGWMRDLMVPLPIVRWSSLWALFPVVLAQYDMWQRLPVHMTDGQFNCIQLVLVSVRNIQTSMFLSWGEEYPAKRGAMTAAGITVHSLHHLKLDTITNLRYKVS